MMKQYSQASNETLLRWYKESDAKAFEEFYHRNSDMIFNYICSLCHSQADASDIFQETFLKAHKYTKSFDETKSALGWIFQIARNSMIDHIKGRLITDPVTENKQDDRPSSFAALEAREYLKTLLSNVSPEDKILIESRFLKEMSFEDISKSLGLTETNTRQKLSRVLKRIRKNFSEL